MISKLLVQAIVRFMSGLAFIGLLLFVPAGTLDFWNAWLLIGILFIPMFIAGIIMIRRTPELLRKRLQVKEEQPEQKMVVLLSGIMFIGGFVLSGLNYRYGWIVLPNWLVAAAAAVFICSYMLYAEVLRENVYLSRIVEIQEGQRVISTGLYGIVRHPMYAVTMLMFLSMPLVLGSPVSFVLFLVYPFIIAKRIRNEEQLLEQGLDGYCEYKNKVKYRLIPFVW